MHRPGRPLGSVGETLVSSFRALASDPPPRQAAEAFVAAAEPLLAGNDPPDGARLLLLAAARLVASGEAADADDLLSQCRKACATLGSSLDGACDVLAARLLRARDEAAAAARLAHGGLDVLVAAGTWVDVPDAISVLGGLAVDAGRDAEGLRLLAAADAARVTYSAMDPFAQAHTRDARLAAERLGPDADAVRASGAALDLRSAISYAARARGQRKRPSFGWDSLTPTELAVVRLAAAGLTNPAIGEQMFISRGTVKTHLEHVYAKLGVRTRTELATAATRRGLV